MWSIALILALIFLVVSVISGALGYKKLSVKSAYLTTLFSVIFVFSFGVMKTLEFFGY